jgi:predicted RNase H-like HicB family nuclease
MSIEQSIHTNRVKVIIERMEDGYVAYPLGMKGIVVGQGDSYNEALIDVTSAIRAHLEEFGPECLQESASAIEAFIAEAEVPI